MEGGLSDDGTLHITVLCPVDLIITDPLGRTIGRAATEIPSATYIETDLDLDGDVDDQVYIPNALDGTYEIKVEPEPGADPSATFDLIAMREGRRIVLAEAVEIESIPDTPYSISTKVPDGLNVVGPIPNHVSVGDTVNIDAMAVADFTGQPGWEIVFTKLSGDVTFRKGAVSDDGVQASVVSDIDGVAEMTFTADAAVVG